MKNFKINLTHFLFLPFVLATSLIFNSCTSYKHSSRISNIADQNIIVSNKIAVDLNIDLGKSCKGRSGYHKTVSDAKDEAYYDAIQTNSIHVLVDPIYSVQTIKTIFGSKSSAEVAGFAGYYKNSRSLKAIEDAAAAEKNEKDKQQVQNSIKNFKTLSNIGNITGLKEVEKYRVDENCKPCPIYKTENRTNSADEFFHFLSIIK
jgi:hypothetical protein